MCVCVPYKEFVVVYFAFQYIHYYYVQDTRKMKKKNETTQYIGVRKLSVSAPHTVSVAVGTRRVGP